MSEKTGDDVVEVGLGGVPLLPAASAHVSVVTAPASDTATLPSTTPVAPKTPTAEAVLKPSTPPSPPPSSDPIAGAGASLVEDDDDVIPIFGEWAAERLLGSRYHSLFWPLAVAIQEFMRQTPNHMKKFADVTHRVAKQNMSAEFHHPEFVNDLSSTLAMMSTSYFLTFPWDEPEAIFSLNTTDIEGDAVPHSLSRHSSTGPDAGPTASPARRRWQKAIGRVLTNNMVKRVLAKRQFVTLLSQLTAVGEDDTCLLMDTPRFGLGDLVVERQPTIVFLGGGMGAGKSSVVAQLRQDSDRVEFFKKAVLIEADAFKMTDPVFQRRMARRSSSLDRDVHKHSTGAAEQLLLAAINKQRDIIFDGTMAWLPFIQQTMDMVRQPTKVFQQGPGYVVEGGVVTEEYWRVVTDPELQTSIVRSSPVPLDRRTPYRIEMVGVTCAPEVAVARGLRRYIRTKRPVPIRGQIRSHVQYATNFRDYSGMVDSLELYDTTSSSEPPTLVARKSYGGAVEVVDAARMAAFERIPAVDTAAEKLEELFPEWRGEDGDTPLRWPSEVEAHAPVFDRVKAVLRGR